MADAQLGSLRVSLGLDSAQFTQSLTDINRRIRAVRSEFDATSDGTREYAQSLEGLRSRNDMLNRQLPLQRAAVAELRRQYELSRRETGETSAETEQLAIRYNRARNAVNRTETSIRNNTEAIREQTDVAKKAQDAIQKFGDKAKEIGGAFSATLTPAIAAMGAGMMKVADDAEGSTSRIQATLGITRDEASKLSDSARDMWEQGFGESMEEVEAGLLSVKQNMGDLNESDLEQVTKDAMTLAGVFDADVNEVTRAGQNLMKGFGIDSTKAFDLMAYGAQNGLNFSQEMFDNLAEYTPLYKDMGFSAEEYFQLLEKGSESGVYNLDYINDAMKEFQIKMKDGSKATADAMNQLPEFTQKMFKGFQDGKVSVKDMHNAVIKDLQGMDDQTKANQVGVGLYGTKWEDMEKDTMYALGNIDGALKGVDGSMKKSGENVDKTFSEKAQIAWRKAQSSLIPLGEELLKVADRVLPKVIDGIEWVTDKFENMSPAMQNIAIGIGAFALIIGPVIMAVGGIATAIGGLVPIVTTVTGAIAGAGGVAGALGAAFTILTGPVGLVVAGLALAGLAFYELDKAMDKPLIKSDIFTDKVSKSTQKAVGAYQKMDEEATLALDQMAFSQTTVTQKMADDLVAKYEAMGDKINTALDKSHERQKKKTQDLFAHNSALTEKEEAKILANMDKKNEEKKKRTDQAEKDIKKILDKASKERRALTEEERIQISGIQNRMQRDAVLAMSKSEEEQLIILGRLRNQSGIITAEQATKVVKNSLDQKNKSVAHAEKQYKDTVKQIEYMRDVTGVITAEQARNMIGKAKEQRDKSVTTAQDMHKKVVKEAKNQAGEHADQINWETGKVKTGWDQMWDKVSETWNWILGIFGIKPSKKKGKTEKAYNKSTGASSRGKGISEYANGTRNGRHAGGMALVGEEGAELAHIPGRGLSMLGVGGQQIVDLPKGSSVLPHRHTQQVMKQYGIPMYAGGVGDYFSTIMKGPSAVWDLAKGKFGLKDSLLPSYFTNAIGSPIGHITKLAKEKIKELISNWGFGGGDSGGSWKGGVAGPQQVQNWVKQALAMTNTPMDWLGAMMVKAKKESGYNPRAINLWDSNYRRGTPSKGLFQTIDPTFNAYKMKGMNDIYNPIHNTVAAIRYIKARYGTVFNTPGIKSMARGGAYKGYSTGGIIDKEHLAMVGEGNKKEVIIPLEQNRGRAIDLWQQAGHILGQFTAPQTSSVGSINSAISSGGNVTNNYNIYLDSQKGNNNSRNKETINVNIAPVPVYLDSHHLGEIMYQQVDSRQVASFQMKAMFKGG